MNITKTTIIFNLILFISKITLAQIKVVDHAVISVSNTDSIKEFYVNVLQAKELSNTIIFGQDIDELYGLGEKNIKIKSCMLKFGNEMFELQSFEGNAIKGKPIPEDSKSNDLWFQHIAVVVPDIQKAYEVIKNNKAVFVSSSPQTLPSYLPAASGISAFYFRDPDGHNIEIINFPNGKGDPKWQNESTTLFKGIDHTAIGVFDSDKQNEFYENILGMKVAGHSENYGSEQEHLNQVFGAHLLITGMKAPKGPGIEYLQYLAPPGGRKYPENTSVLDLWHWHTHVRVDNIENIFAKCKAAKFKTVSQKVVTINNKYLDYTKAFMVRDADGHFILITN